MNANNPKKVRAVECGNLANRIQLHRTVFFFIQVKSYKDLQTQQPDQAHQTDETRQQLHYQVIQTHQQLHYQVIQTHQQPHYRVSCVYRCYRCYGLQKMLTRLKVLMRLQSKMHVSPI